MGNSQLEGQKQNVFILPKKVQEPQIKSRILPDLNTQLQQVFGTTDLPTSFQKHKESNQNFRQLFQSACILRQLSPGDKQYEERIANLENELMYLRNVVENIQGRPESSHHSLIILGEERKQEEIKQEDEEEREVPVAEPEFIEINTSVSHLSQTYFCSPSRRVNPDEVDSRVQVQPSSFSPMVSNSQ